MEQNRHRKWDIFMILALLVCAFVLWIGIQLSRKSGSYVLVSVEGKVIKEFPLDTDVTYTITTKQGENQLQIRDGEAKMVEADCRDKLCVHQTAISKAGETIVCLPHKVVVEIDGAKEAQLDGITN